MLALKRLPSPGLVLDAHLCVEMMEAGHEAQVAHMEKERKKERKILN